MTADTQPTLSPEQDAYLRSRSDWMGAYLVLHAWGVIALAMAFFIAWPNPLSFVIAVVVIGGRQLGLAILMHDAAHRALAPETASPAASFAGALTILLREGLEALLIVVAIIMDREGEPSLRKTIERIKRLEAEEWEAELALAAKEGRSPDPRKSPTQWKRVG